MMTKPTLLLACSLTLLGGRRLATEYSGREVRRIEVRTNLELEEMVLAGGTEERAGSSKVELREVLLDRVASHADGRPTRVERTFEEVEGKTKSSNLLSEGERVTELGSPFAGLVLAIARDAEGALAIEVAKGRPPDQAALEGHVPELFLDGLLPAGEVEVGATWKLDAPQLRRALRLDLQPALHRLPPAPAPTKSGRKKRHNGAEELGTLRSLAELEWKGQAKLLSIDGQGGDAIARIRLEIEATGELSMPTSSEVPKSAPLTVTAPTATVRVEGELTYSLAKQRPAKLAVEGPVHIVQSNKLELGDSSITIETRFEGRLAVAVEVSTETL